MKTISTGAVHIYEKVLVMADYALPRNWFFLVKNRKVETTEASDVSLGAPSTPKLLLICDL